MNVKVREDLKQRYNDLVKAEEMRGITDVQIILS